MALVLTKHPQYITTGGYGCVFNNYGLGPGTPEEPTIITKFFGSDARDNSKSRTYDEEKRIHKEINERCGNKFNDFSTMDSIFGIDLNVATETYVYGYNDPINVKGKATPITLVPGLRDVSPTMVCEQPNYNGSKLSTPLYKTTNTSGTVVYPVIKNNNLGTEIYKGISHLRIPSFIQMMEIMALFHTGMIHNDIKGNNMLISPLSGKVSLIDFGVCKPFNSANSSVPYRERSYPVINESWFAYPPEYTFLRSDMLNFRKPDTLSISGKETYTTHFLNEYVDNATRIYNPSLENCSTEKDLIAKLNIVYDDYFLKINKPQIYLQTAITGDMYAIGLELLHNYGIKKRDDYKPMRKEVKDVSINIGTGEISGLEFLKRMNVLLTALHPRFRPFHINIMKLYNHYNPIAGAKTIVKIRGQDPPYCELSILNGQPAEITVEPGMALGSDTCPITPEELLNNMKILYFLLQKPVNEITDMLAMSSNLIYDDILKKAEEYILTNPSPLFIVAPEATVATASNTRTDVKFRMYINNIRISTRSLLPNKPIVLKPPPANLIGVPVAEEPQEMERKARQAKLRAQWISNHLDRNINESVTKPEVPIQFALVKPPVRKPPLPPKHVGGEIKSVNISRNLIQAGILAPAGYFTILKSHSQDEIDQGLNELITVQRGGDTIQTMGPVNIYRSSNKNSNWRTLRKTMKNRKNQEKQNMMKKLKNLTRSNSIAARNIRMPTYSDIQLKCFYNEIITSTVGGKLNELYHYYIQFFPEETQKEILSLLFFVPLADISIISKIMDYLNVSDSAGILEYLTDLKEQHLSVLSGKFGSLELNEVEPDIVRFVNTYIQLGESRYASMLDFCNKIAI